MPQPFTGPATRDGIKASLPGVTAGEDAVIEDIASAVNALVRSLPVAQSTTRTVTVTTASGSTGVTAAAGTFLPEDVSAVVTGTGISAGASLASVTDWSTATLSAPATATGTVDVTLESAAWKPNVTRGANMLGARLWKRRNSPEGVTGMSDAGPVYIQRTDPDVAQLLQIGAYTVPQVG